MLRGTRRSGRGAYLVVGVGGRGEGEEDEEREGGERGATGGGHWRREWPAGAGAVLVPLFLLFPFPPCVWTLETEEGDCCLHGRAKPEVFKRRGKHTTSCAVQSCRLLYAV